MRFECEAGGEGLRSLSILLLFLLFCWTSSSRRPTVVRPNTPRNSNFCAEKKKKLSVMFAMSACVCLHPGTEKVYVFAGVLPLWSHPI